jgi:hypothetical protein
MTRSGHSSTRAALIYQHATDDRDRQIADGIDVLIQAAQAPQADIADRGLPASGTYLARNPRRHRDRRHPACGLRTNSGSHLRFVGVGTGGRSRDRTCDHLLVREVLYR